MALPERQQVTSSRSFGGRRETVVSLADGGMGEEPMDTLEREVASAQEQVQAPNEQIKAATLTAHSSKTLLKPWDIALLELKHLQGLED